MSFLIVVVAVLIPWSWCGPADMLMCYFQSASRHRAAHLARFEVEHIDFSLCTHYIYASAKINNDTHEIASSDPQAEEGPTGLYRRFVDGKKTVPSIKTMISVGGVENSPVSMFSRLGQNSEHINQFANSVVRFLVLHGFDGLDFDWVYPSNATDKIAHSNILQALHRVFSQHTQGKLLLTATGHAFELAIQSGYDPVEMA
ncbi:unnamed protein product, partial [Candidula unifasciata]